MMDTCLRMPLVYIAGPYRHDNEYAVHRNIQRSEAALVALLQGRDVAVHCPHKNCAGLGGALDGHIVAMDLEILKRCDVIVMLPGWQRSEGAQAEIKLAKALNLEVRFWDPETREFPVIPPRREVPSAALLDMTAADDNHHDDRLTNTEAA